MCTVWRCRSSLGGLATSKIGTSACFWLDAVTYIVAAFCAFLLSVRLTIFQDPNSCPHASPYVVDGLQLCCYSRGDELLLQFVHMKDPPPPGDTGGTIVLKQSAQLACRRLCMP